MGSSFNVNKNPRTPSEVRKALHEISKILDSSEDGLTALEAVAVTADSTFGTDGRVLLADGTQRKAQASSLLGSELVDAPSPFGAVDQVLAATATGRGAKSVATDVKELVTAGSAFSTGELVEAAGNDRTTQSSGILSANVPTMGSAAAGLGNVITSAGADKTLQDSGIDASTLVVDADIANSVTADSTFGTDGRVIVSDGTQRKAQASSVAGAEIVTAASAFPAVGRVLLAGGNDRTVTPHVLGETLAIGGGANPILLGDNAGVGASSVGVDVVGIGPDALAGGSYGNGSIGVGSDAFQNSTVDTQVVGVGRDVGEGSTIGNGTILIGQAGLSAAVGVRCFLAGGLAGFQATIGNFSVGIGPGALRGAVCGTSNFAFGRDAGRLLNDAGANDNLFFGNQSGNTAGQGTAVSNTIVFGANTRSTVSNQIVLGGIGHTQTILRGDVDVVRSTNSTSLRVYNTSADDPPGTSYELVGFRWDTNDAWVDTEKGSAGGTARDLVLGTDNTERVRIGATGNLTIADGEDIVLNGTTGSKIGTGVSQKLGFWDATPIVQPAAAGQAALSNNTGGSQDANLAAVGNTTTSDQSGVLNDNFTDLFTLLDEIRTALVNAGLMKGAA